MSEGVIRGMKMQLQQGSSRVAALLLLVEVCKTHNPIFFRSFSYCWKAHGIQLQALLPCTAIHFKGGIFLEHT
eukprot:1147851-Pelagomonas_calceolata.AAC.2